MNKLIILIFISSLFFLSCGSSVKKPVIKLYAVKYGSSLYPSKYIYSYQPAGSKNFAWMFYLIQFNERNILVDTGFSDQENIANFKVEYTDPLSLLKELKLSPDDITDVIITHSHFDHSGDIQKYKNANIYIQLQEMDELRKTEEMNMYLNKKQAEKKLFSFYNRYILNDFISIKKVGGHSPGSCSVKLATAEEVIFLPGDEAYFTENFEKNVPTGTSVNPAASAEFTYRLYKLLAVPGVKIFTFHDPGIIPEKSGVKLVFEKK
ncbi:MAG: MBL fold metallo-hydrolase [Spirochaetes bacterium]|nr:MBL fold metallo-hydrolase [Spirochaetota bacterium]